MARLRALLSRVRGLFSRRRLDSALDEELRAHVEMLTDDYVRAGLSPEEARRQARLRLGGIEQTKEIVRDQRATWIDSVWQDVRYALRTFGLTPGFTEVAEPRFYLILLGAFAASAMLLVLIGVYGVLSYTIARRTHEFGVRLALGAERRDIRGLLFGLGARLALVGVVLGVAGALVLTRVLSTQLYGVRPRDPLTLACAVLLLAAVVMVVCALAARRATRIDPMTALRCE